MLDEPINGLDVDGMPIMREVLTDITKNKDRMVLISSHILGELEKVATHYGIIRDGRMVTARFLYIMVGICLAMPVLMLVMTTSLSGAPAGPAGDAAAMDTFTNNWKAIGTVSGETNPMAMGLTTMCNINMLYFLIAVVVCVFVAEDFRSGYAKNIFTIRAGKADYVISKLIVCSAGCGLMFLGFFAGTLLGGAIAGLPFGTGTAGPPGCSCVCWPSWAWRRFSWASTLW